MSTQKTWTNWTNQHISKAQDMYFKLLHAANAGEITETIAVEEVRSALENMQFCTGISLKNNRVEEAGLQLFVISAARIDAIVKVVADVPATDRVRLRTKIRENTMRREKELYEEWENLSR